MTMLAEHVDVVIGIDTHKHTHTAAVVAATTGAVLETITVSADPDGYGELVELADAHAALRAWAIEGTGTYGADLTRVLQETGELVHELDRPKRPKRRMGEKNDELDAIRTARDALARKHNAIPRRGAERAALSVLIAGRRSAVDAAKVAHVQLQALICAAPEQLRSKFRGQRSKNIANTAAQLRMRSDWDLETRTYGTVLRDLARRRRAPLAEAKTHVRAGHHGDREELAPRPPRRIRRRPHRRRDHLVRLVPPWPVPQRGSVRQARRRRAHTGLDRRDQPAPLQPLRRPTTEPCAAPRRHSPNAPPRRDPRLCPASTSRGKDRPRNPPLPQALRRPRLLPTARTST